MSEALTPEDILDAAASVLRRFGPRKTTVVDVARELGVSHGAVYRHFASKAALRDAVAARWLAGTVAPLNKIADADTPAPERLREWLTALVTAKRKKVSSDPEMFASYYALAEDARAVVADHVEHLLTQITKIVAEGIEAGDFRQGDPRTLAAAVFNATLRFHHPAHAHDWNDPAIDTAFRDVLDLALTGISAQRS